MKRPKMTKAKRNESRGFVSVSRKAMADLKRLARASGKSLRGYLQILIKNALPKTNGRPHDQV